LDAQASRVIYHIDDLNRRVTVLRFWHAARGTPKVDL
jgi:mRNA-degrading endonuclease RelE of RelBE toxin-antitoxin system